MRKHSALNCEMCGDALEYYADNSSASCLHCKISYTFSTLKSEALVFALNRANAMRINCDFDGAINEYSHLIRRYPDDAEAHWGLALSKYGVYYVDDARIERCVPICCRTVKDSILQDADFLAAVKHSAATQAEVYKTRASVIDEIQRDIKRKVKSEEDFDVFLCFRALDDHGTPTRESEVARRIYDELTSRNIKTFFSEVTFKGRKSEDHEAIIYKALYSCKFFVLIACSEKNINDPWVKNEWSRFRNRIKNERLHGACCAVYNAPVTSLPAFIRSLNDINLAKYTEGGYEKELANRLQNRFFSGRQASSSASKILSIEDLLCAADKDLNGKLFENASAKYQQVLKIQSSNGRAWWGCFLSNRKACNGEMAAQSLSFGAPLSNEDYSSLKSAERYGDRKVRADIASFCKICENFAAQCNDEIKKLSERLENFKREKEVAEKNKDDFSKKMNKYSKSAFLKISWMTVMGILGGICYLLMTIVGIFMSWILVFIAFIVLVVLVPTGAIIDYLAKTRFRKAKEKEFSLSVLAKNTDVQIKMLSEEIAMTEDKLLSLRLKEESFLRALSK